MGAFVRLPGSIFLPPLLCSHKVIISRIRFRSDSSNVHRIHTFIAYFKMIDVFICTRNLRTLWSKIVHASDEMRCEAIILDFAYFV